MLEAIRDFYDETGRRDRHEARRRHPHREAGVQYLVLVNETLGDAWLTPDLLPLRRLVAPERRAHAARKQRTGRYQAADYFTKD